MTFLFMLWGVILAKNANAYIDPGIAVAIWQLLLAGLVGAVFFIRTLRLRFMQIFLWAVHLVKRRARSEESESE